MPSQYPTCVLYEAAACGILAVFRKELPGFTQSTTPPFKEGLGEGN